MKTKYLYLLILLLIISCSKTTPSFDLTEENSFTEGIEGPATDHLGNIYAVNFEKQGTIGKVSPDGKTSVFLELPKGSIGNGIRFGNDHQMFIADYTGHNILQVDLKSKNISVFAHQPQANQPNDITISSDNIIYASDPDWETATGNIWKVTAQNGFQLLEANMGTTNGIEVSKDGKKLYVNESVQRKIWVYDVRKDGTVENKKEFFSFPDFGLDGMRFDQKGNLFVCRYGKGTVIALSPKGEIVKEYHLNGKNPTNITFSKDFKIAYITVADRGCIEAIKL